LPRKPTIPEEPIQELSIAPGGPVVNSVIAAVLLYVIEFVRRSDQILAVSLPVGQLLSNPMSSKVALCFFASFNLLAQGLPIRDAMYSL